MPGRFLHHRVIAGGESIGAWLKTPNPAFEGSSPLQVIERGESGRIWRMLYLIDSGEPI